jgi:hypothetical protein
MAVLSGAADTTAVATGEIRSILWVIAELAVWLLSGHASAALPINPYARKTATKAIVARAQGAARSSFDCLARHHIVRSPADRPDE